MPFVALRRATCCLMLRREAHLFKHATGAQPAMNYSVCGRQERGLYRNMHTCSLMPSPFLIFTISRVQTRPSPSLYPSSYVRLLTRTCMAWWNEYSSGKEMGTTAMGRLLPQGCFSLQTPLLSVSGITLQFYRLQLNVRDVP